MISIGSVMSMLITGLVYGIIYALLAFGFSLIFGVARILNLAHTTFYMICAYLIYTSVGILGLNLLLSSISAILITGFMGMICHKFLFDRVKERETAVVIIGLALSLFFQEILILVFGTTSVRIPPFISGFIEMFGTRVSYQHVIAFGITGITLIGTWGLISKTKLGNAIRAVAQDREIANVMGIDVNRVLMVTMGLSVALAGVAGAVVAPIFTINPLMWLQPIVVVLSAVILGGLGSIKGSIIAAFILGLAETAVVFLVPSGSFLKGAVSLSVMVIVLLIKPEGLFGIVFEEERL